jgi:uncharacterized protein (TIGR00290 family)
MKGKLVMAWSGGKDSAAALDVLQRGSDYEVVGLLTTITGEYERISMHGVRVVLLEAQARALGLELHKVVIPSKCNNEIYEQAMGEAVARCEAQGVTAMGFGDLFLEDIREYRERMLQPTGIEPVFPIWGRETGQLAREVMDAGFRATLCCVDPRALDGRFVGRAYDPALLEDLPSGVDPCGENGEFHTLVHDAPNFREPLRITHGDVVEREGFWFCDLMPAGDKQTPA